MWSRLLVLQVLLSYFFLSIVFGFTFDLVRPLFLSLLLLCAYVPSSRSKQRILACPSFYYTMSSLNTTEMPLRNNCAWRTQMLCICLAVIPVSVCMHPPYKIWIASSPGRPQLPDCDLPAPVSTRHNLIFLYIVWFSDKEGRSVSPGQPHDTCIVRVGMGKYQISPMTRHINEGRCPCCYAVFACSPSVTTTNCDLPASVSTRNNLLLFLYKVWFSVDAMVRRPAPASRAVCSVTCRNARCFSGWTCWPQRAVFSWWDVSGRQN